MIAGLVCRGQLIVDFERPMYFICCQCQLPDSVNGHQSEPSDTDEAVYMLVVI